MLTVLKDISECHDSAEFKGKKKNQLADTVIECFSFSSLSSLPTLPPFLASPLDFFILPLIHRFIHSSFSNALGTMLNVG